VKIGYRAGNGSSGQAASTGGDGRGTCETSDEEVEEVPALRPETKSRTNEGMKNKRQRTGIPDQSKEYFGVAMDKMAATLSSVVASAINSSGAVGNKDREYEQQRRERVESQLREFELKQKLIDQRHVVEEEVAAKYQMGIEEASAKLRRVEDKLEQQSQLMLIETAKTAEAEREQRRIAEEARESKVVLFVVAFYDDVGGRFCSDRVLDFFCRWRMLGYSPSSWLRKWKKQRLRWKRKRRLMQQSSRPKSTS
jgi:hypothetical protein